MILFFSKVYYVKPILKKGYNGLVVYIFFEVRNATVVFDEEEETIH